MCLKKRDSANNKHPNETFFKKNVKTFGGFENCIYLCNTFEGNKQQ